MLKTTSPTGPTPSPPTRSRLAYAYLLRVPIGVGIVFAVLPYVALRTRAAALLLGLFDVSGVAVWAVATSAFMLSLAVMTTCFLVTAYADQRCGAVSIQVAYPIRRGWYVAAALLAAPTLVAVIYTGDGSRAGSVLWAVMGGVTAVGIYELARWLMRQFDRIGVVRAIARWLSRHPELGAGYVDLGPGTFLPGHRLSASLMLLSAALYALLGRRMADPNALAAPTLAYVLLLLIVWCWALAALAFFLDRFRVPTVLPIALLIIVTGTRGGSDHYFQVHPSWATDPLAPAAALAAHRQGTPERTAAIVVAANGGGIQAAAWTARVLTGLQEACREQLGGRCRFAESLRLISAVSGGSVGSMYISAAYHDGVLPDTAGLEHLVAQAEASSLERVGWGLLYRDLFRPLYTHFDYDDRGSALEDAWQRDIDLSAPLESWRESVGSGERPATIFNATISDSGERFLMGTANPPEAAGRRNLESLFPGQDVSIVTAARLSAAFTYVSPAARADNNEEAAVHFVDGGYYDVYGFASLVDWLDAALARDANTPSRISRVLVLQLRGAPPDRERKGKRRGWFYQAYAPISAVLGARDTGQLTYDDEVVSLLRRAVDGRVGISSVVFQFCGGSPPLSWHMTREQKARIASEWGAEREGDGTRAVIDFLRTAQTGDADQRPVDVKGRCQPVPALSQQ